MRHAFLVTIETEVVVLAESKLDAECVAEANIDDIVRDGQYWECIAYAGPMAAAGGHKGELVYGKTDRDITVDEVVASGGVE